MTVLVTGLLAQVFIFKYVFCFAMNQLFYAARLTVKGLRG